MEQILRVEARLGAQMERNLTARITIRGASRYVQSRPDRRHSTNRPTAPRGRGARGAASDFTVDLPNCFTAVVEWWLDLFLSGCVFG